jgi:hypothetical protein
MIDLWCLRVLRIVAESLALTLADVVDAPSNGATLVSLSSTLLS